MSKHQMECCVCGCWAGFFEQWYNRDTGYGICSRCATEERLNGASVEWMKRNYGIEGVHYGRLATT